MEKGKDDKEVAKKDKAKLILLERMRAKKGEELKKIRDNLKKVIATSLKADPSKHAIVADQMDTLKARAMKVSQEIASIVQKMDVITVKDTKPSPEQEAAAEVDGALQTTATAKQLAFQLFCNDKRQEVALALASNKTLAQKASVRGVFAEAIDAQLASMWAGIPEGLRAEYIQAARAALVARDTTWNVAQALFIDASSMNGEQADKEALSVAWKGLAVTEQSRFFIAAQSLALGKPNAFQNASDRPQMKDAVASLTKSVSDLAFDLYADENWRWAKAQVIEHAGHDAHDHESELRMYPDVQHLLAKTYANISTSMRQGYLERAEQLMSTSFFAGHVPTTDSIGQVNSLTPPLHRTLLSFTLQFVGLGKRDVDRKTAELLDETVEAMLHEHLSHKFRLVQQNSIDDVDVANACQRRYIISLVNNNPTFVDKTIDVVKASVEQGEVNKALKGEGIKVSVLFPIGGLPSLLTDPGVYEWTCKSDAHCNWRGVCEEGKCRCKMEAKGGKLYDYSGYDCSFGPSIVCPEDCSFHGVCQQNGKCSCAAGYSGAGCEIETCVQDCSGHGVCFQGQCACEDTWEGPGCSLKEDVKICRAGCNGHGKCGEDGECVCKDGRSGDQCEKLDLPCPSPCDNGGKCNNGTCACAGPWGGDSCKSPSCPGGSGCSGNGKCEGDGTVLAKCVCGEGWAGPDCACQSSSHEVCSGHGLCHNDGENDACYCHHEWGNEACSVRLCSPPDCSGHGECREGTCGCDDGWKSDSCGVKTCLKGCEEHGTCDGAKCDCNAGFLGVKCSASLADCPEMCNEPKGQGTCSETVTGPDEESVATCVCEDKFDGPSCGMKTCEKDCGHGLCRPNGKGGECHCEPNWFGEACDSRQCTPVADAKPGEPSGCTGHGTCALAVGQAVGGTKNTCTCDKGWVGGLCEIEASLENCAVCCLNKCLSDCHKEHNFQNVAVMTCFHKCQPGCVEGCQLGEEATCPGDIGNIVDALTAPPHNR